MAHKVTTHKPKHPASTCTHCHHTHVCTMLPSLHPVHADSCGSDDTHTHASSDTCAACNGATQTSELAAFTEAAVDCCRWVDWFTAELLHWQKQSPAQGDDLGSTDKPLRALRGGHNAHDLCDPQEWSALGEGSHVAVSHRQGVQATLHAHGRRLGGQDPPGGLAQLPNASGRHRDQQEQ